MLSEYRDFILKTNTLSLAIGVIIGAATSKLVTSIVDDLIMPICSFFMPTVDWSSAKIVLSQSTDTAGNTTIIAIKYGHFASAIIDFLIISFVVFMLTRILVAMRESPAKTKQCPECLEEIPQNAKKCRACCSLLISG